MSARRMFRPHRVALAVTASAVAVALTACSSSGGSSSPSSPGGSVPDSQLDPNAVLHFSSAAPLRNLDPILQTSYGGWGYLALTYDRLTMLDKNDNIVPGLATSWSFAKDGTYLELKLRSGVTFHDGAAFDAQAVKVNVERAKSAKSAIKNDFVDVTGVSVVDDSTVRLNVKPGTGAQLPSALATVDGMMVSPKAIAERPADLAKNPGDAGSGPYVVTSFVPNEKLVMKKAPGSYWDPAAGRLGGIELDRVADGSTRLKGVQTGITDLTTVSAANDLTQAKQLADRGTLAENTVKFRNILGVYLRANQGDLTKPQVRQAIAYAIDPNAISALFSGTCTPNRQMYPEGSWPAIKNYQYPYAFDLAKAKDLVKQAGGAKVKVTYAASTNTEQPATVILNELKAAGIDASLNPVPNSENEPRFIAGDFELMVSASYSPKVDPAETTDLFLLDTYKLAADPSLIADTAAKAGDPRLSQEQRAPLYAKIWQTSLEQAWFVPVCQQTVAVLASNKVVGADNVPWANIGVWDLRYIAKKR